MMTKNKDPTLALLEYRTTPGPSGYSPSELLMGRRLRARLPVLKKDLRPMYVDHETFREWDIIEVNRQNIITNDIEQNLRSPFQLDQACISQIEQRGR
jgi:hypothetical protein